MSTQRLTARGGGKTERSASEVEPPSGSPVEVPVRSSSTEGYYRTIIEEEEEEEEKDREEVGGRGLLSMDTPLPATVVLSTSSSRVTKCLQRSERVIEEASSVGRELEEFLTFTNHSVRSPTPEPEMAGQQSPGILYERGGSVEPLIDSGEDEKPKDKSKRSLFSLRKLSFEVVDGKSRKKSSARFETDLVFTNESSEDSAALIDEEQSLGEGEGVKIQRSSPSSSLAVPWTVGVNAAEEQSGVSMTDGGGSKGEREGESWVMYKSSSEGNIHRLSLLAEMEEDEEECEESQSVLGTMSPLMMRRVASSETQGPDSRAKKKSSADSVPQDFFSSAIIPSSHLGSSPVGPVGPRSQSPILSSPFSSPQSRPSSQLALRRGAGEQSLEDM